MLVSQTRVEIVINLLTVDRSENLSLEARVRAGSSNTFFSFDGS